MKYLVTAKHIYKVEDDGSIFLDDKEIRDINKEQLISNLTRGNVRFESLLYTQKELDDYKEANFLAREQRRKTREEKKARADDILYDIHYHTPKQIYEAFEEVNKTDFGESLCKRIFISSNPLSNYLVGQLGEYTVTPYENGQVILMTTKAHRYSNKRGYNQIYDLL